MNTTSQNSLWRCIALAALCLLAVGCRPQVTILVPDMMCEESCVVTVHDLLEEQPGVFGADVDFATKTATVTIDPERFDAKAAIAELADRGFVHSEIKSLPPDLTKTDSAAEASAESDDGE